MKKGFSYELLSPARQVVRKGSVRLNAMYDCADLIRAIFSALRDSVYLVGLFVEHLTFFKDRKAYNEKRAIDECASLSDTFPTDPTEPVTVAVWITTTLENVDEYTKECDLMKWTIGSVHKIPLIQRFLGGLGGCTTTGEIFWRLEDKLLVSFLIRAWFQDSNWKEQVMGLDETRALIVGSPGVGKSVITCVLAFYVALVRKMNVLVYRTVPAKGNFLFYIGYEDQEEASGGSTEPKLVYFTMNDCREDEAFNIYRAFRNNKMWLFLDGLIFNDVPPQFEAFKLLATSLQVDIKASQIQRYDCLLSSWKKEDLFELGKSIYNFTVDDMENRYFYSGGSVREFARAAGMDMIKAITSNAICGVAESDKLFSSKLIVRSHEGQIDHLRRTFLKLESKVGQGDENQAGSDLVDREEERGFFSIITHSEWEQVVDSAYALQLLTERYSTEKLLEFLYWAVNANYPSVAECIHEIYTKVTHDGNRKRCRALYEGTSPTEARSGL